MITKTTEELTMTNQNNQNIVVYNDGELELKVPVNGETIWLSQSQISEVFQTSVDNVGLHLKNIYKKNELDEFSTTENFLVVEKDELVTNCDRLHNSGDILRRL